MRLLTRGDVDGLMCATLLKAVGIVEEILQVEPQEMQHGIVAVSADDIVCNLPYVEGCGMWFDHHSSEQTPGRLPAEFVGKYGPAPSAARLVYEYFVDEHPALERLRPLLEDVDSFDSAELTLDDLHHPQPTMLLAFVLDPRTGLGNYYTFRLSDRELCQILPDLLLKNSVGEILEMPDLRERVECYWRLNSEAERVFSEHARIDGNVLILDLRDVKWIPPANRFLIYTLPGSDRANISLRLSMANQGRDVSFRVAHNIFNRSSGVDVGRLMARYGGGGHRGAGGCHVPVKDASRVLAEVLGSVKEE